MKFDDPYGWLFALLLMALTGCVLPEDDYPTDLPFFSVETLWPPQPRADGQTVFRIRLDGLSFPTPFEVEYGLIVCEVSEVGSSKSCSNLVKKSIVLESVQEWQLDLEPTKGFHTIQGFAKVEIAGEVREKFGEEFEFRRSAFINLFVSTDSLIDNGQVTISGSAQGLNASGLVGEEHGIIWSENDQPDFERTDTWISLGEIRLDQIFTAEISLPQPNSNYNIWSFLLPGEDCVLSPIPLQLNSGDRWTLFQDGFVKNMRDGVAVAFEDRVYFGLSASSFRGLDPTSSLWVFDFSDHSIEPIERYPGIAASEGIAFRIGKTLYFGLGAASNGFLPTQFFAYQPGEAEPWTPVSRPFPGPGRTDAVVFVNDNKAYIGTGLNGSTEVLNDFYEFDPGLLPGDPWRQIPGLETGRTEAVAFAYRGEGYVGLGTTTLTESLDDFYRFDGTTWNRADGLQFAEARKEALVITIGERVFAGFGEDFVLGSFFRYFDDFYELKNEGWRPVSGFNGVERSSSFAAGTEQSAILIGGVFSSDFFAEVFDDVYIYEPQQQ